MRRTLQSLLAVIIAFTAVDTWAAGELMIHPTRVVLEGTKRTGQIDLINSGTETVTYRISLVRRRMTESGSFVAVDDPGADEHFADEMIRFSPRQVVLRPGVAQAVRLQVRKPAGLADGEYRAHLMFQALPSTDATSAPASGGTDAIDIRLTPIYGASIPIIVRHGQTGASLALTELELRRPAEGPAAVAFTINRGGSRSVYGDLTIRHRNSRGAERVVGRANGMAVYTPNAIRKVVVPVTDSEGDLSSGELIVSFSERPDQPRRLEAEARLPLR
ncbi:MAG TPA: molecular chaperone [Thermoanaerobaculia bacterium]